MIALSFTTARLPPPGDGLLVGSWGFDDGFFTDATLPVARIERLGHLPGSATPRVADSRVCSPGYPLISSSRIGVPLERQAAAAYMMPALCQLWRLRRIGFLQFLVIREQWIRLLRDRGLLPV